jgi:hypothetical protein
MKLHEALPLTNNDESIRIERIKELEEKLEMLNAHDKSFLRVSIERDEWKKKHDILKETIDKMLMSQKQ